MEKTESRDEVDQNHNKSIEKNRKG